MRATRQGRVRSGIAHFGLCMLACVSNAFLLNVLVCPQVLALCNSAVASRTCIYKGGQHLSRSTLAVLYAIPAKCMFGAGNVSIECTVCKMECYSRKYNSMCDQCGDRSSEFMRSSSSNYGVFYCGKCGRKYHTGVYYNVCDSCGNQNKREDENKKAMERKKKETEELGKRKRELEEKERILKEKNIKKKGSWKRLLCYANQTLEG